MRVGTRGSRLAMAQARKVCGLLSERGVEASPAIIKTSGDVHTSEPLHAMKGVGAFVREIDDRLLAGEVDIAVHSLKDVPTKRPEGLATAAVLKRESALDVAVTREGKKLSELEEGAVVGTSSTRRAALIKKHYPHLRTNNIRGNVDTRLRKLGEGEYDAILLAEAGLIRLGMDIIKERLDPYDFVPSANQGVIAIVARPGTPEFDAVSALNDHDTWLETGVERAIASALDGGCVAPMGAYARLEGDGLDVVCEVLSLDGRRQARVRETIPVKDHERHALRLAEKLAACGGRDLVEEAKRELRR
ncbi:probable porphobilinogen deaminase [Methanocella paludicola SANAE]|uniref:Probable porphobilinogen deaminase n=1 Tax=Methanocella paludicola (strain DSM 17711 / JCM 13418 / NBRC 101707 / SANAE) TaxID=304371 RepID=D1Z2S5_METPS|nr:hydroxymethylbilane synthase [Methanocella paludicola]BAI62997.1 probable porphobilinogen deaminase [Methanocella paludicola SANAE]